MMAAAGSIGALCVTSFHLRPPTGGGRTALLAGTIGVLCTAFYLFITPDAEREWRLLGRRAFGVSERARGKEGGDLFAATVARVQRCLAEGEATDGVAGTRAC